MSTSTAMPVAPAVSPSQVPADLPADLQADRPFDNGHFGAKGSGDNIYRGPLEPLPVVRHAGVRSAAEAMFTDGYVTFPEALDRREVSELRALMDSMGGPDEQYENKNWCFNKHVSTDFQGDLRVLKYIDRSGIIDVVEAVLGPACRVIGGSMWITGKGRAMGMHVDAQPVRLPPDIAADPRVRMPIFSGTVHFYLDDLCQELGPTLVIPGSHRAGHAPHNEPTWNGVAPRMVMFGAGGACFFRHDLWHGAAMNSSDRRRYMMQVHYSHPQMGIWNPPAKAMDPAVFAAANARQRRLLGDSVASIATIANDAKPAIDTATDPKRAA